MQSLDFTTNGVPLAERYDAWQERPWPCLARMMRTNKPPGEFYSHSRIFRLGGIVWNETRMKGQTYQRTSSLVRSDGFNAVTIAVTLGGRFHGETRAGPYKGGAGSVLIGDMGAPFLLSSTNGWCVTLVFEKSEIRRLVPKIDLLHGLALTNRDAAPLVRHVTSLIDRLPALEDGLGGDVGEALTGTFLSCLGATGATPLSDEAHLARLRTDVRWIIEHRYREPDLDVARIAALARVSRATLYRAFSGMEGILAYATRLRIEKAAEALSDPRDARQIGEIAQSVGFERACTFNRAFRRTLGCSPREWRGQALDMRESR